MIRHKLQSALSLWNRLSKKLRKKIGHCEVCGSLKYLHVHHLLSRFSYPHLALNTNNLIVLCDNCHIKGKNSFHSDPLKSMEWLKNNKPELYNWMIEIVKVDL